MKKYKFFCLIILSLFLVLSCTNEKNVEDSELVKPADWYTALPRPVYSTLEQVDNSQWWFEVYKLPGNIYAIYEPYQFEEALCYLVIGEDRAALIDAGTGVGDLKKLVDELTDLPVTLINTHAHYDHVGDNYQFSEIAIYESVLEINKMIEGVTNQALQRHIQPSVLREKGLPEEFDPQTWTIPGIEPTYLLDSESRIDLGGRELEVIFTPGHSPGHICLLERDAKILFTGDLFYPGALYAFGDDVNVNDFRASIKTLCGRIGEFDYLLTGHNEPWVESKILLDVDKGFETIFSGGGEYTSQENLRRYKFDRFDIIVHEEMVNK